MIVKTREDRIQADRIASKAILDDCNPYGLDGFIALKVVCRHLIDDVADLQLEVWKLRFPE